MNQNTKWKHQSNQSDGIAWTRWNIVKTDDYKQGWLPHHFCGVTTDQHGWLWDR